MSFAYASILWGLGLIAVPVVLHFLLRQKPRKLLFPALRLIQARQRNNVRRMRLRHLWLLLLRILVIALLILAVAQPRLPPAEYGFTLREWLTLLGIAAAAIGVYVTVVRRWTQARLPHHVVSYRRTLLRGGTGVAAGVLLLLLLVWPYWRRIEAELAAPQKPVKDDVPVAAVFLFDTSASMNYRLESTTRLDRARELAETYLERLPARSRVAIGDSTDDSPFLFQADLTSARARLRGIVTKPASRPLDARIQASLVLQDDDRLRTSDADASVPDDQRQDRYLREVYVFTDLARSAWRQEGARRLHAEMERRPWVGVYLIDVGVKQPANVGISSVRLSRQTVPAGSDLIVEASLDAVGIERASRTVELSVKGKTGEPVKKGQSTVTVDAQAGARVAFTLPAVEGSLIQGEVRIVAGDPLGDDDARHFTAVVKPAPEVLLVAENSDDVVFWREAIAPTALERLGKSRYRTAFLPASRLDGADFAKYDAVCLINVPSPSERVWDAIAKYVAGGGGLGVFLGTARIDPVSYNSGPAQTVLPAKLAAHLRFPDETFLDLQNLAHPILRKFEDLGGPGELTSAPIFRHWLVEPTAAENVIAAYDDDRRSPALLERAHGQGRAVMLTTAVDLKGWSELPLARWSFVALADQAMQHLSRFGEGVYNYSAGEGVVLPIDRRAKIGEYLLRKPGLEQLPGTVPPDSQALVIDSADQAGQYEVVGTDAESPFLSGFSVNVPAGESDFAKLGPADLDLFLGEKRYRVAEDAESLERIVSYGRIGQEMFPFVVAILLAFFVLEHVAANWFYGSEHGETGGRTLRMARGDG